MKFCAPKVPHKVIVHADDFGIGVEQSRRILACARVAAGAGKAAAVGAKAAVTGAKVAVAGVKVAGGMAKAAVNATQTRVGEVQSAEGDAAGNAAGNAVEAAALRAGGALNSLSVLVTSPRFRECAELLKPISSDLHVGLHVNLVEGPCAANPADVPLLVDEDGVFKRGFGGLLLASIVHPRASRGQLTTEIGAQLGAFLNVFPELKDRLRIDSHQHFHLIPAVFDSVVAAVEAADCTVEYIRIPAEPLRPFLRARAVRLVPPINWVKQGVLNVLWQFDKRKVPGIKQHTAVFCGIGLSGRMTKENVSRVARAFKDYATAKGMPVEFLFHPGGVASTDECLNPNLPGFVAFYTSPNRAAEAEAATTLNL